MFLPATGRENAQARCSWRPAPQATSQAAYCDRPMRFLVGTGAKVSVLPVSHLPHSTFPAGPTLQAVNHSAITTFGSASRTINLGLRRTFRWVFLIADVKHPILGVNFLHHFNLLVDMTKGRLVDAVTHLQVNGVLTREASPSPSLPRPAVEYPFTALLQEFSALIVPIPRDTPVKHSVVHCIDTTGSPVHAHPCRLAVPIAPPCGQARV